MKRKSPKYSRDNKLISSSAYLTNTKLFESSKVDFNRISNVLAQHSQNMKLLQERVHDALKPTIAVSQMYTQYFEQLRELQEQVLAPSQKSIETLKLITESSKVFESINLAQLSLAKCFKGLVINLPLEGYSKALSTNSSFELTLDKFTSIKSQSADYLLTGTTIETTKHESVGLRVSTGFEMRISSMESKLDSSAAKLDYLIEKDIRRDELLNELVGYIKSNGTQLARIQNVSYNHASTEIIIDNIHVKLRSNTNQSQICKVLLYSKKSIKTIWEMEDITKAIGETNSEKNWHRAIYDTIKEVNTKVLIESKGAIPDFFQLTTKTVSINPKYIA